MTLTSFDAVFFTVGFLVPGFIWSSVLSMLVPRRPSGKEIPWIEFLTFSCINHGLWSWALFLIFRTGLIDQQPYWSGVCLVGIIFVSPIILGLVSAALQQKEWIGRFLRRLGFRTVHPIPAAWDYYFSREQPGWVLVTLKNGSRVYGFFGEESFAGDDPTQRDLYLEMTCRLLPNGDWAPVEDTGGVLINSDQIATLEFRKLAEDNRE